LESCVDSVLTAATTLPAAVSKRDAPIEGDKQTSICTNLELTRIFGLEQVALDVARHSGKNNCAVVRWLDENFHDEMKGLDES
jgi:hypothetical protein